MTLFLLLACSDPEKESTAPVPEDSDSTPPVDTSPPVDTGPEPGEFSGSVATDDGSYSGSVATWHTFSFANEKGALVYVSSGIEATCEALTASLLQGADPSPLFQVDRCNVLFLAGSGLPTEGEYGVDFATSTQVLCTFSGSTFVEDNGAWRWNGDYYVGTAKSGNYSLAVGASGVTGEASVSAWDGSFPYESGAPSSPASGSVAGSINGVDCPGLEAHSVFQ